MSATQRKSLRQEHGPADAYYSLLPDFQPHPVMRCLCGWLPEKIHEEWETLGKEFDAHILTAVINEARETIADNEATQSVKSKPPARRGAMDVARR